MAEACGGLGFGARGLDVLKRALLNREIGGNAATLRDLVEKDLAAATLAGATTTELTL